MNKFITLLFGLLLTVVSTTAQTARVQVIHNSADAAAAAVDVYLNDIKLIDDFAFRTASSFIDAPAGVEFTITIAPANSASKDDGIWSKAYTLEVDKTYVIIASGIVSASGYDPATAFDLYVYDMGREAAETAGKTDVLVFHGSTDAPMVDVVEVNVGAGTVVDDISFGEYQGYLSLDPAAYSLQIRTADGATQVAQFGADLSGLGDAALTVVASGFLDPTKNSDGDAFGLFVATAAGGALLELPAEEVTPMTARVQVIHNSADAAAATVDVYLDDALLLDDFAFRTASPFVDAPAGKEFTITIAPANSASKDDGIWSKAYTLEENETYVIIASGIVSASGYDPATAFDLYVYGMGREAAETAGKTDVLVFHGSTDAPMVDVVEVNVGAGTVVDDISFGEYQGYLSLDPADYSLQIRTADGATQVAQFGADLSGLGDAALTVVASGFLDPTKNSDGDAFGLFVATAAGGALLELPAEEVTPKTARVQVIHNSADAAAATVDVYLDDALLLDDFAFRTASPFVDAPAGTEFTITIAPANSASKDDGIWSKAYTLEENETYVIIASGIVSASGYDPATAFDLYVYGMGREAAETAGKTDVLVFHGSTDAPTVDVAEVKVGAGTIVDDLSYGEFDGYLSLDPAAYSLQIQLADGTPVAQFGADLSGLGDAALTVVASGFLDPTKNSDGDAFGLFVATAAGGALLELPAEQMTARVQVIHNSADAAAATVDVYLDDALLLDDFAFRTASPFVDAPAGVEFTITIAPANSASKDDGIWSKAYTLAANETYVIIANGIVSASGYDPATAFDLYVYDMGREAADTAGKTDVLVFHGSTDAPMVDVVEVKVGAGTIVDDISYGEYQGYLSLDPAAYSLQIQTTDGTPVAQFGADLSTLGDAALTVVASGFLDPTKNSDGAAFGLFVATAAGGALLELPAEQMTARVQVIHNSADAAAATVDVYLDDALLLDDFAFRTASPFVDAPAGTEFTITIAPANSASKDDGIWSKAYTLAANETYVIIANGIVSASGYDPATAFDLYVYGMGREAAETAGKTDVLVFHGSTDAPMVDVVEVKVGAGTIVDDISYGEYQGYLSLDPAVYSLQIQTADGATQVAQFGADLSGLGDAALTVVASGFLDPTKNSDGDAFGLFVATAAGGALLELPAEEVTPKTARVQVIHNSADAAAATVDVYLDDALLLDDFAFRTASPFVDAPAGVEFTITIAPANSASKDDGIWSKAYTLEENETYVIIANGIVSASGYDPATAFDLYVYGMGREAAETAGKTDVLVFHGSTDAPMVDVVEVKVGAGTIVDDISYGEYQGYLSLDPAVYSLQIQTADGATQVAQFGADLSGLGDAALTVVASGFLDPTKNSDGDAFGLFVATAAGGALLELPAEDITSISERRANNLEARIYPNPATSYLSIAYDMEQSGEVTVEIFNITGQKMMHREFGQRNSGNHEETINLNGTENGIYMIRLTAGDSIHTSRIKVSN